MTFRFLEMKDLFEIKCKKCGSSDVKLYAHECSECGMLIDTSCNNCGSIYKYHDFKEIDD